MIQELASRPIHHTPHYATRNEKNMLHSTVTGDTIDLSKITQRIANIDNNGERFKEKPELFSYVPDKMWDAFANAKGNDQVKSVMLYIFQQPRWEYSRELNQPPKLIEHELTEERIMNYDYSKILNSKLRSPENTRKASDYSENLTAFVTTFKEELSKIQDPSKLITEQNEFDSTRLVWSGALPLSGIATASQENIDLIEMSIKGRYEAATNTYFNQMQGNLYQDKLDEKGIDNKFKNEITSSLFSKKEFQEAKEGYVNHLLKENSNIYNNLATEHSKDYYLNMLEDIILETINSFGGKFQDPDLYRIRQMMK